jgi:hypothetical protein
MRGRFGFFGVLAVIVLALLVGGVAYSLGLAAGQTATVVAPGTTVAPGTVVYPVGYGHVGWGFGFPFFGIFGILFVVLLIGLLVRAFRPRPWGGGGPGGWGRGGWSDGWSGRPDDVPPPFRPMLEAWHRRAHGEAPPDPPAR